MVAVGEGVSHYRILEDLGSDRRGVVHRGPTSALS